MPDEKKNFGGCSVLDLRISINHMKTNNSSVSWDGNGEKILERDANVPVMLTSN